MVTQKTISLEDIIRQIDGEKRPPVHLWNPDFCGDIDMRIAADGTWFYMGTPITRMRMVKLFSTVLRKDGDGKTYLVTPVEKIGITVDDAHFVATGVEALDTDGGQALRFTTNVGDTVIADKDHPVTVTIDPRTGEPRPYIAVRDRLTALINRPTFYALVDLAEEREGTLILSSAGQEFSLGKLDE